MGEAAMEVEEPLKASNSSMPVQDQQQRQQKQVHAQQRVNHRPLSASALIPIRVDVTADESTYRSSMDTPRERELKEAKTKSRVRTSHGSGRKTASSSTPRSKSTSASHARSTKISQTQAQMTADSVSQSPSSSVVRIVETLVIDPTCWPVPLDVASSTFSLHDVLEANVQEYAYTLLSEMEVLGMGRHVRNFTGRVDLFSEHVLKKIQDQLRPQLWEAYHNHSVALLSGRHREVAPRSGVGVGVDRTQSRTRIRVGSGMRKKASADGSSMNNESKVDDIRETTTAGKGSAAATATASGVKSAKKSTAKARKKAKFGHLVPISIRLFVEDTEIHEDLLWDTTDTSYTVYDFARTLGNELNLNDEGVVAVATTVLEQLHCIKIDASVDKSGASLVKIVPPSASPVPSSTTSKPSIDAATDATGSDDSNKDEVQKGAAGDDKTSTATATTASSTAVTNSATATTNTNATTTANAKANATSRTDGKPETAKDSATKQTEKEDNEEDDANVKKIPLVGARHIRTKEHTAILTHLVGMNEPKQSQALQRKRLQQQQHQHQLHLQQRRKKRQKK